MSTYDPMARAQRRTRLRQRLGPAARCLFCGDQELEALRKVDRAWLEQHHALGRAHNPELTVVLCRRCHARVSASQQDDGVPLKRQPTLLETLLAVLTAAGSFFRTLAEALFAWITRGKAFLRGLDADFPTWRRMPWATL